MFYPPKVATTQSCMNSSLLLSGETSKISIDTMGLTENLLIGTAAIVGVYATYEKYFSKAAVRKRRQRRKNREQYAVSLTKLKSILSESTQGLTQEVQSLAQYCEQIRQSYKGKASQDEITNHLKGKLGESLAKVESGICKKHDVTETQVLMAWKRFEGETAIKESTRQLKALVKILKLNEVSKSDLPEVCQTIDTFINITSEMMGTLVGEMKQLDEALNPGKNRAFYQNPANLQMFQRKLLSAQRAISARLCKKYGITEKEYQDSENYFSSTRCSPEEQQIFRQTIQRLQMQIQQTQQAIGLVG